MFHIFTSLDIAITRFINEFSGHSQLLDFIMTLITQYGVFALVLYIAIQWWGGKAEDKIQRRYSISYAGISSAIALLVNQGILLFIHRLRPYDVGITHLIISPSQDWSFPSDHATLVFSIALAFLIKKHAHRFWYFTIACIISFSRIFVGIHYVSDIFGGFIIAIIVTTLLSQIYTEDSRINHFITKIF